MLNRRLLPSDLAGRWRLTRRIDDFRDRRVGTFRGFADVDLSADGFTYGETGTLRLEGSAPMAATRRYLWRVDGGRVLVSFEDGRFFHGFDPGLGRSDAVHRCGEDDYRVIYTFLKWPDWRAEWRVRGPRKDYRMLSDFVRA